MYATTVSYELTRHWAIRRLIDIKILTCITGRKSSCDFISQQMYNVHILTKHDTHDIDGCSKKHMFDKYILPTTKQNNEI